MGGNSKNGPEYFFRKHLKEYKLPYEVVSDESPKKDKYTKSYERMKGNDQKDEQRGQK